MHILKKFQRALLVEWAVPIGVWEQSVLPGEDLLLPLEAKNLEEWGLGGPGPE